MPYSFKLKKFAKELLKQWYPTLPDWVDKKKFREHFTDRICSIVTKSYTDRVMRFYTNSWSSAVGNCISLYEFADVTTALAVDRDTEGDDDVVIIPADIVKEFTALPKKKLLQTIDTVLSKHDNYEPEISKLIMGYASAGVV